MILSDPCERVYNPPRDYDPWVENRCSNIFQEHKLVCTAIKCTFSLPLMSINCPPGPFYSCF